ncbi:MAG TPA: HK97 gp10 family phage protein [Phycisphaerae bacterium]|nr:HK97 gp10 family phage protein [Phycisphaerae bacterium]
MADGLDISKFISSLEKEYQPRAQAAAESAVERFALYVVGEAARLCPVKTGALKASWVVEQPESDGDDIEVTMGFNTSYAAAVHEILTNHHAQGQAKYLETALKANAPKLVPYVEAELHKEFG